MTKQYLNKIRTFKTVIIVSINYSRPTKQQKIRNKRKMEKKMKKELILSKNEMYSVSLPPLYTTG